METPELPAIGLALPINSETRWSDLLAVMVATDPEPACKLLGLEVDPAECTSSERSLARSTTSFGDKRHSPHSGTGLEGSRVRSTSRRADHSARRTGTCKRSPGPCR